jgi:hypothetical protein
LRAGSTSHCAMQPLRLMMPRTDLHSSSNQVVLTACTRQQRASIACFLPHQVKQHAGQAAVWLCVVPTRGAPAKLPTSNRPWKPTCQAHGCVGRQRQRS